MKNSSKASKKKATKKKKAASSAAHKDISAGEECMYAVYAGNCPLEQKLAEAQKMVAIGKMASNLAHGVRNPLNAIKGAVVYLREKFGHEATLLEFSTIINEEIDKLDAFISNFLSASRGKLAFTPVNVNSILKSIMAMIRPRSDVQDIRIREEYAEVPLIAADSFQLEQAMFNIVNNAMEAMPEGGMLSVASHVKWENGKDCVLVEIADTGRGIPDQAMKRLGKLAADGKGNDRGFGIFLSREVIRSHNGTLLWESAKDSGTVFKILLPVQQGE